MEIQHDKLGIMNESPQRPTGPLHAARKGMLQLAGMEANRDIGAMVESSVLARDMSLE